MPASANRPSEARTTTATSDADETRCRAPASRRVAQPERVAALAQADIERHGCPAPDAAVRRGRLAGRRCRGRVGRGRVASVGSSRPMVPRTAWTAAGRRPRWADLPAARRPRPGRRRRPSSGPARSRRRRRPRASAPRSRAARSPRASRRSSRRVSQSPWNPTMTLLVLAPPAAGRRATRGRAAGSPRSCLEGRPAVADPAGQPGPGGRLAADHDRWRRARAPDGRAPRSADRTATAASPGRPLHSARMTATASSSRATRSGAGGKSMP